MFVPDWPGYRVAATAVASRKLGGATIASGVAHRDTEKKTSTSVRSCSTTCRLRARICAPKVQYDSQCTETDAARYLVADLSTGIGAILALRRA